LIAEADHGHAVVSVAFGGISASRNLSVIGYSSDVDTLPKPCAAELELDASEISHGTDWASIHPFSLPSTSVVRTLSVHFCEEGQLETASKQARVSTWPAVINGTLKSEALHWNLSIQVVAGLEAVTLKF
jgi:hypothetical protein